MIRDEVLAKRKAEGNGKKSERPFSMADSFKKHLIVNYKWRSLPVNEGIFSS